MLSIEILFDIHIGSLWYQALEMLPSEILFDIHIVLPQRGYMDIK